MGTLVDKIRVGLHRIAVVFQGDEVRFWSSRVKSELQLKSEHAPLYVVLPRRKDKNLDVCTTSLFTRTFLPLWSCLLLLCSLCAPLMFVFGEMTTSGGCCGFRKGISKSTQSLRRSKPCCSFFCGARATRSRIPENRYDAKPRCCCWVEPNYSSGGG